MALQNKKNFNSRDIVRTYNQKYFSKPEDKVEAKLNDIQSDPLPDSWTDKTKEDPFKKETYIQTRLFY